MIREGRVSQVFNQTEGFSRNGSKPRSVADRWPHSALGLFDRWLNNWLNIIINNNKRIYFVCIIRLALRLKITQSLNERTVVQWFAYWMKQTKNTYFNIRLIAFSEKIESTFVWNRMRKSIERTGFGLIECFRVPNFGSSNRLEAHTKAVVIASNRSSPFIFKLRSTSSPIAATNGCNRSFN